MAFPATPDPTRLPLHVLFPESYAASKRTTVRDFVFFGAVIVLGIVGAAALHLAASAAL